MLQKSKSKKVALIKYALLIPMLFAMLIYTSAEVKAQEKEVEIEEITEVIEVQEIDEKALIEKYYKQMKAHQKANEFSKIMDMTDFDILKFRMPLDEFARLKAFTKITFIDRIEPKLENGKATDSEKEIYKKFTSNNESYLEYIKRTNTDEYGHKWETRTEGSTLKLYVKDLKNKTKSEEERLNKKRDLILNDSYWDSILISDGNQSSRIEMSDVSGKIKTVTEVEEVQVKNIKKSIEVPYAVIENAPTFKECKDLSTNDERRKCTSNSVAKFVNKNFNTDLATKLGLEGRQRISVFFKIDKQGNVTSVGARAPHPALEAEAERVIKLLPQFIPGTQKGKPVIVPYSLPIIFQVYGKSGDNTNTPNYNEYRRALDSTKINQVQEIEVRDIKSNVEVPYAVIDNAPVFPECKDLATNDQRKKCTSNAVAKFVNKNFNTDLATKLGLEGRQRISVFFKIDKQGNIATVGARAPHPALEEEAKRVIKLLPQFIPGTQKGRPVVVPYSLPILFQVAPDKKEKN